MVESLFLWTALNAAWDVLAAFVLFYWLILLLIHFVAIAYGCNRLHRRWPSPTAPPSSQPVSLDHHHHHLHQQHQLELGNEVPGVTILKPLVGKPMDPNLETNLKSYFNINYPKYEIRFCVAEKDDPCCRMVQDLMNKYEKVEAQLHIGADEVGVNPKINNVNNSYQDSKYDLLLISDAGIFMKPDTLTEMVSLMASDVGIVQQLPFIADKKGWPATLEKVFFGGSHARMYLFLHVLDRLNLKVNCCSGMSCLIRKKMLQQAGGIKVFGKYLAEDYFMAKFCQENGWRMLLSSIPAMQNHGTSSVQSYIARVTRWTKLRIKMNPATIIFDPLSECLLLGLLASLAATIHLQADFLAFFLFHSLAWILADWTLINILQNGPPPFSKFEFVVTWLFRELSAPFVFLSAVWDPVIYWRTGHFRVHWGGEAEKVDLSTSLMSVSTKGGPVLSSTSSAPLDPKSLSPASACIDSTSSSSSITGDKGSNNSSATITSSAGGAGIGHRPSSSLSSLPQSSLYSSYSQSSSTVNRQHHHHHHPSLSSLPSSSFISNINNSSLLSFSNSSSNNDSIYTPLTSSSAGDGGEPSSQPPKDITEDVLLLEGITVQ